MVVKFYKKAREKGIKPLLGADLWIESLMGKQITLKPDSPKSLWLKLNHAWALFFFFMGVLNIYVAYTFSEDIWVNFKLFGGIGLLIAFVIAQGLWLSRYMDAEQS